jgi:hypothetical protein
MMKLGVHSKDTQKKTSQTRAIFLLKERLKGRKNTPCLSGFSKSVMLFTLCFPFNTNLQHPLKELPSTHKHPQAWILFIRSPEHL